MNYKNVMNYQPWLRLVNIRNISDRFLKATNNDMFVVFNTIKDTYELHSVDSFRLTGYSHNTTIDPVFLNGYLLTDYKANNFKRFAIDVISRRQKLEHLYEKAEQQDRMSPLYKKIERTMGTKI